MKKIKKKAKKVASKGIHTFGIMLMVLQSVSVPLATGALFAPAAVIAEEANLESPASDSSSVAKEESEDKKDEAKEAEKETPKTLKEEPKLEAPSDKTKISTEPAGLKDENIKVEPESVPTGASKEETGDEKPADTGLILPPVEEGLITPEAVFDEKPSAEEPKKLEKIQEKECLPEGAEIKNNSAEDWTANKEKGTAETKNPVKLGIKYQFPLDDKVSVTFTCLPTDPAKLSTLKIERIKTAEMDFPKGIYPATEYAYDLTTGMKDGDFEYDFTLPGNREVENVYYIEKTASEVKNSEISKNDLKKFDGKNVDVSKDKVEVENVDHFTVMVATGATPDIVINEFSSHSNPEWVELYNKDNSSASLAGWKLLFDNNTPAQTYTFSDSDSISGNDFLKIEKTNWLNNSGDTITLKDPSDNIVDEILYGDETGSNLTAPGGSQSGSRCPNGTGSWIITNNPTPGSANDCGGATLYCGDGIINGSETCDGGSQSCSAVSGYLGSQNCLNTCDGWGNCNSGEYCGDAIKNGSEQCDDGNSVDNDVCSNVCQNVVLPVCGDGIINQDYEQCDDGNLLSGDGCSAACQTEREGSISGKKFEDCNADGIFEPGCETGMRGWTIFIDSNGNGVFDAGETSTITNRYGDYSFPGLLAGTYRVCEIQVTGWMQTMPGDSQCYDITLNGEDLSDKNFGNFKLGSVQGRKFNDLNGNGWQNWGEEFMNDWTIRLYNSDWQKAGEKTTSGSGGETGKYFFDSLEYGTYYICEAMPGGWQQTARTGGWGVADNNSGATDEGAKCYKIEIDCSGEIFSGKFFGNQETVPETGTVTVIKYSDDNENGIWDDGEAAMPDWDIVLDNIASGSGMTQKTDASGQSVFENLSAGDYKLSENIQTGWKQTNISCELSQDEQRVALFESESAIDSDNDYPLTLVSGDNVYCEIGNHPSVPPVLTIEKFNDQWPNLQSPGAIVDYTITIRAFESNVRNVIVKDLMPNGFSFNSITSVVKNGTTNLSVPDPAYHSPGTWQLGGMENGDEIVIKFKANVGSSQQAGTYKDNAWAKGDDDSGGQVLALSVAASGKPDPGNINTNFVGTKIALAGNRSYQRVELDEDTEIETETKTRKKYVAKVLGASTGLPATGSDTLWIILALAIFAAGIGLILWSRKRKNNNPALPSADKVVKILIFVLVMASIAMLFGKNVQAASNPLNIRLEQPDTPTGSGNLNIGFVVLDIIGGRNITVDCWKKGPSDLDFSVFSTLTVQTGGNSGTCDAVFNTDGVYEIYAKATAGSDSADSQIEPVSVNLNSQAPGTPLNYDRDGDNCGVTFTTANDGLTSKVELYRSKDREFTADASTFSTSVNILPNTSGSLADLLGNCGDYLYAIRAVSASGAGSGFVGDEETNVETKTRTRTRTITRTTTASASQSGAIPTEGGTIAGEETKPEEGEVAGEKTEEGKINGETAEGETAGETSLMSGAKNSWLWIILALIVLGIAYYAYKKSSGKNKNNPEEPDVPDQPME